MPMPDAIDNSGGGILGAVRTVLQADANITNWFTANGKFNVHPGVQFTKVPYPYINLFSRVINEEQDSAGGDWRMVEIQASVYGEGYEPTRYVKEYVYTYLRGKLVTMLPYSSRLTGSQNPEPLIDRERSAGGADIYHVPLKFRCMVLTTKNPNAS